MQGAKGQCAGYSQGAGRLCAYPSPLPTLDGTLLLPNWLDQVTDSKDDLSGCHIPDQNWLISRVKCQQLGRLQSGEEK